MSDWGRTTLDVGLLYRRTVRAALDSCGLDWKEHKGWLSSFFIIEGDAEDVLRFMEWFNEMREKLEAEK